MFKPVQNPPDFPAMDHRLLEQWDKDKIFERSINQREGAEDYVFYDGPPGTNAPPHIGHMMQSALKDLWPRYQSMRGKRVLRKAGWDTHGLPVELTADRDLKLESKKDIENYGVKKYTEYCRSVIFNFKSTWEEAIHRLGRFLDMENFYATFKTSYIQSDWWVLKQAWNTKVRDEFVNESNLLGKDRFLYKDYRISAWCPRQGTTLSNFEVAQGYKDVTEIALFPKFKVKGEENLYLVAWTTTAWTLLSNIAIAAGPTLNYVRIRITVDSKGAKKGEKLIVAKERLADLERFLEGYEIEATIPGTDLADIEYEPLWDFQQLKNNHKGHFVVVDEYVTADDGTGMVHLAPYGEDDHRLMKQFGLQVDLRVNAHGYVVDGLGDWSGKWFKDDDLEIGILKNLAGRNLLLGKEKHDHTYPFHYKTGSPLIYFPRPGWFIRTTAMRDEMLEANKLINWVPPHIRDGRFGKWLENVIDWNITRERFWGSPLPIWSDEDNSEAVCASSIAELNEHIVRSGGGALPQDADLHKPGIDEIVLTGESGKTLKREDFVLDSWFNAGIMPWGQYGYPAEEGSEPIFENQYPCDFICEGLDQTRGWFYSMLACSTLLAIARGDEDKKRWTSYKTVICTDLVLDESGEKMSKSKGNVVAPVPMMEKYGADAIRWSFFRNNPWLPIRYGEEALRESLRQIFIPLWNAYSFFVTYANVDEWEPDNDQPVGTPNKLDRWILACYCDMLQEVTNKLENYDVKPASDAIADFIDRLTNWYIRRSRRRFWKSEEPEDKQRAYLTLYTVLTGLSQVFAPFAPFISEELYGNLVKNRKKNSKDSVHLEDWPSVNEEWIDSELRDRMDYVRQVVSLGHAARNDAKMKVRQPLSSMIIVAEDIDRSSVNGYEDLIIEELNVKAIEFSKSRSSIISQRAKANFKLLGPRFGKEAKSWAERIENANPDMTSKWAKNEAVDIEGEAIQADEVILEDIVRANLAVKEEGSVTVALNLELNDTLLDEGYARELINKIQNRRKDMDLEVTKRINLTIQCDERLQAAINNYRGLIAREVLAEDLQVSLLSGNDNIVKVNDLKAQFELVPV